MSAQGTHRTDKPKYRASIIIGLVFVILASLCAWFFAPKGDNQTYVPLQRSSAAMIDFRDGNADICCDLNSVWRSSLILAFSACYIMWGMFRPLLHTYSSVSS
jgi:hypothetical protein